MIPQHTQLEKWQQRRKKAWHGHSYLALRQGEAGPGNNKKMGEVFSVLLLFGEKRSWVQYLAQLSKNSQNKKIDQNNKAQNSTNSVVILCDTMRHPPMPSCRPFGDTKVEVHTTIDHSQQSGIRKHDTGSMSASLRRASWSISLEIIVK